MRRFRSHNFIAVRYIYIKTIHCWLNFNIESMYQKIASIHVTLTLNKFTIYLLPFIEHKEMRRQQQYRAHIPY